MPSLIELMPPLRTCVRGPDGQSAECLRPRALVTFPLAPMLKVLSDYTETTPEKNQKVLLNHCNHVTVVIKFSQHDIVLVLLKE